MSRSCTPRVRSGFPNPLKRGLKPVEIRASRAQRRGLCVWDVEFKSPLAHKETCRSEAYGRHPGTLRVRWGYTAEPYRYARERTSSAFLGTKKPPTRCERVEGAATIKESP